jgi:hypothetical protein
MSTHAPDHASNHRGGISAVRKRIVFLRGTLPVESVSDDSLNGRRAALVAFSISFTPAGGLSYGEGAGSSP